MVGNMVRHKLTDAKIKGLSKPGIHADGAGLYLRVHSGGSRSWFFIYSRNRIRRELGLGGFDGIAPVGLALARRKADDLRQLLADGRDPYAERATRKSSAATFGQVALRYIEEKGDWSPHTEKEWRRQLLENSKKLGSVSIDAINTELIESTLRPFWESKPATGQRIRGKIEAVLDFATAKRLRTGENPARWSGHLEHILTAASRVTGAQHAAMPYKDVPAFISQLGDDIVEQCLRLVILTAVRSGEARGADWAEFDLETKTWSVPEERTKTGRPHNVPLSDRVVSLLQAIGIKSEGLLFPGARDGKPIGITAMPLLMNERRPGLTTHGFRSAFSDWGGEETEFPREIVEWSLGHKVGNAVERAYRRQDALEKRRALMTAWAKFCDGANG